MREIKFRAWDSKNKKMWFPASFKSGVGVDIPNEYLKHEDGEMFLGCRFNGVIIMQYTGLLDKQGVEIYEGDIVDVQYNYINNCVVAFNDGKYNIATYKTSSCEVIGNIYENPELLN